MVQKPLPEDFREFIDSLDANNECATCEAVNCEARVEEGSEKGLEGKKYNEGMIPVSAGAPFGFSEDVFEDNSYLWKVGNVIYISLIMVKSDKRGDGEFKGLVRRILEEGFEVRVPTPIGHMRSILNRWGFSHSYEKGECGLYEVWSKKGSLPN